MDPAHPPEDGGLLARLRRGERWSQPGHLARVVLDTGDKVGVGFQLGIVELVLREHEDQVVGHLGPDLLGPDWDEHEAAAAPDAPTPTGPSARPCSTSATSPG